MNWNLSFLKNKKTIILGLALVAAFSLLSFTSGSQLFNAAKNMELFAAVLKEVNTYYVDPVSPNKMTKKAIDAMCKTLDPYTVLLAENDIEDYRLRTSSQHADIGISFLKIGDSIFVSMVKQNQPSEKAGLQCGDRIVEISGESLSGKSNDEINKMLVGSPGTAVNIKVVRAATNETITKNIVREEAAEKWVPYYGLLDDETGYIQFTSFMERGSKEINDAIDSLKSQSHNGLKSVVLDLRSNGGGLLMEAVNIVNLFVPKGTKIVDTRGRLTEAQRSYATLNEMKDGKIKVAILTNHNSASASEIVSGCMQDLDRGIVVGTKSYGKGLVQVTKPISYGNQIKVTISKYYTPAGRCIQVLDYSHRNGDGSVGKIPDSLKHPVKTKAGRTVYDGGGIEPDVLMPDENISLVTKTLKEKNLLFGYAVKYFSLHPTTNSTAKDFSINENDFNDFLKYLSNKTFSYNTNTEKKLEQVKKSLTKEKYISQFDTEWKALEQKVKHDNEKDVLKNKTELMKELNRIIAGFYFHEKGEKENTFKTDDDLQEAIKVLHDDVRYKQLLNLKM